MKKRGRILLIGLFALVVLLPVAMMIEDMLEEPPKTEVAEKYSGTVPLVYSPRYNLNAFGLENLHPFDTNKYQKIHDYLVDNQIRQKDNFLSPHPIQEQELKLVHSDNYLKHSLNNSIHLAYVTQIPIVALVPPPLIDWKVLKPMRKGAGGTILTCRKALKYGLSINVGGGYHHAQSNTGGGFCFYCDVPIAIECLRREKLLERALIVDTDAHQGNGFALEAAKQKGTYVLDFYEDGIYPKPKVKEDISVPFKHRTEGAEILRQIRSNLPFAIDKFKPDLIVYNAGADVLITDPLSTLKVTPRQLNERDLYIVSTARERHIPLAMVLAGGYSTDSHLAQAKSIELIIRKFDKHYIE